MSKRFVISRSILLLIVVLASVPIAYSEIKPEHASPKLIERGANYEVWNNYDGTFTWRSAPQWVLLSGVYVPYVYKRDDSKKCYLIQTGRIGGEIYDSGIAVFYDVNMTEQRVKSEVWEVWDSIGNKKATLNTPITFKVVQNSSGVFINATRTTSKPNGVLTILYCFYVGSGLKHYVYWRNNEASSQTIRIKQVWDLAEYLTKCQVDGAETTVSATYSGSKYTFYDVASTRHVFEDQSAMLKKLEPTNIDFAGKKVIFSFSNWTLTTNGKAEIDPTTETWQVNQGTNDCRVYEIGTAHPPWDTIDLTDSSLIMGLYSGNYYGLGARFTVINIPQGATIVSAYLKLKAAQDSSGTTVNARLAAQDADDTVTFSNVTDYNNRPRTSYVSWSNIGAWLFAEWYDSPNIGPLVQTVINRAEWTLGNSMVIFCEDDGTSTSYRPSLSRDFYDGIGWTHGPKLEITYTAANQDPTIAQFQAPSLVLGNEYFFLNCSVNDGNGVADLVNATIQLSGDVILKWVASSNTFSEQSDPSNYCTLDASGSIRATVNSTAYRLSWKIKLSSSYPYTYVDVVSTNTKVFDNAGASGTNSQSDLFFFDNRPTIGEFEAPLTVYAHQYVFLNATVADLEGKTTLVNATIELSGAIVLKWLYSTNTFSIQSDPSNYCVLNASACLRTSLNTTAYKLSWSLKLAWNYSYSTVSIVGTNTKVYDPYTSGTNSKSGLLSFEDDLIVASASVNPTETPPETNVVFSGTIYYSNTTTPPYSLSGITVNIELSGVLQGSTSTIQANGTWSKTIRAPSSMGNKTYVVYAMTDEMGVANKSVAFFVMSAGPTGGGGG